MSAAATITVVMPLFFYSQADNKDNYRMSITGKLVANMLKKAGVSKVMILDPRTPQLEGFFDGPIDAIKVMPVSGSSRDQFPSLLLNEISDTKN